MKELEKIVIKYLLIGFGIGLINYIATISMIYAIDIFDQTDPKFIINWTNNMMSYTSNIVVGLFVLFDSIKYTKNKIPISIVGFVMPIFGVCFLIIEKYLIQKMNSHE